MAKKKKKPSVKNIAVVKIQAPDGKLTEKDKKAIVSVLEKLGL